MLKNLLARRPKPGAEPAEIAEALASAEAEQRAASERVAALLSRRGTVLLDAPPAEVEAAEAALAEARAAADRAAAMAEALRERLAEAERRKRLARVSELAQAAARADDAWRAFVDGQYPTLAARIAAGLALEVAARQAIAEAHRAARELPREDQADAATPPAGYLPAHPAGGWHPASSHGLSAFVRLPAANGDDAGAFWPPSRG
jgi:hypothetical protein